MLRLPRVESCENSSTGYCNEHPPHAIHPLLRVQVCKQLFGINDDNYYAVSTAVASIMMGM